MPDVVITEFMDEDAVARLSAKYETHYDPKLVDDRDALAALLPGARALIVRNRTQVRGDLLAAAGSLSCVGRLGVGLDNIDVAACEGRGVTVYPATGANDASVAEYVITAALVLLRGAWLSSAVVAAGEWPRQALIGREVGGRTMGLVGFGGIARETAARAQALGMRVIAHDPFFEAGDPAWGSVSPVELDTVFAEADAVSLHVPLTQGTRHMANADRLAMMKPGSVLINAARGGVVDEEALAAALKADGGLSGAALDVFEEEPLGAAAGARFDGLNVLLTPHIAGVTEESNVRVSGLIAERVLAHLG
ncbi:hydroxyacid dehydrogenase [Oceanibium sediminis]|uniref:hydroxyacid dehydrogenase n=1 Tax=Oceanibium sediminis TaxID=2026339 RepID=UPI000DD2F473|nr:hydroxyacid dehydrogenase [Oceanibium sediminis]